MISSIKPVSKFDFYYYFSNFISPCTIENSSSTSSAKKATSNFKLIAAFSYRSILLLLFDQELKIISKLLLNFSPTFYLTSASLFESEDIKGQFKVVASFFDGNLSTKTFCVTQQPDKSFGLELLNPKAENDPLSSLMKEVNLFKPRHKFPIFSISPSIEGTSIFIGSG